MDGKWPTVALDQGPAPPTSPRFASSRSTRPSSRSRWAWFIVVVGPMAVPMVRATRSTSTWARPTVGSRRCLPGGVPVGRAPRHGRGASTSSSARPPALGQEAPFWRPYVALRHLALDPPGRPQVAAVAGAVDPARARRPRGSAAALRGEPGGAQRTSRPASRAAPATGPRSGSQLKYGGGGVLLEVGELRRWSPSPSCARPSRAR